jgi:predicted hotdog family 3-hydroxylacyl-ACP dehydratase
MVDQLLYCDEKMARSSFRVTADNIFVADGKFHEPGLIENMAQTAAARAGHIARSGEKTPAIGYIGDVKNLEITSLPKINDELETEIHIENQIFEVTLITGKVWCKKNLIAQCEMKIFINQSK